MHTGIFCKLQSSNKKDWESATTEYPLHFQSFVIVNSVLQSSRFFDTSLNNLLSARQSALLQADNSETFRQSRIFNLTFCDTGRCSVSKTFCVSTWLSNVKKNTTHLLFSATFHRAGHGLPYTAASSSPTETSEKHCTWVLMGFRHKKNAKHFLAIKTLVDVCTLSNINWGKRV